MSLFNTQNTDEEVVADPVGEGAPVITPEYLSRMFPSVDPQDPAAESGGDSTMEPSPRTTGNEKIMNLTPEGSRDAGGVITSLNVFGQRRERADLEKTEIGKKLLDLADRDEKDRAGFWEAVTRGGWMKLVPYVNDVAAIGMTIKDTAATKKTFEKLHAGEAVSEDELLNARYFIASSDRESKQTMWGMFGGIVSQAPAFALELFTSGGLGTIGKKAITKAPKMAVKTGIRGMVGDFVSLGVREGGKSVGLQALGEAGEDLAGKTMRTTIADLGKSSVDDLAAKILRSGELGDDAASQVLKRIGSETALIEAKSGVGMETAARMAAKNLKYEAAMLNPRSRKAIAAYLGRRNSTMLLDYMDPENKVPLLARQRLGNAAGLLYDAHIKGAGLLATDIAVEKAVEAVSGQELVNRNELMLTASGALQGSDRLVDNARSISLGMRWAEYMSEFTGPAFGEVIGAAGQVMATKGLGRMIGSAQGAVTKKLDDIVKASKLRKSITQAISGSEIMDNMEALDVVAKKMAMTRNPGTPVENLGEAISLAKKELERGFHVTGFAAMLGKTMAKTGLGPKEADKFLKDIAYDGMINEMLEERANGFIQGLYGLDDSPNREKLVDIVQAWKSAGWGSSDQFMAEALGFALPGLARRGLQSVQVNLLAGERGSLDMLAERKAYQINLARAGGAVITSRKNEQGLRIAEAYPATPSDATAQSQETKTQRAFGDPATADSTEVAPLAGVLGEESAIVDGLAEWGAKLGRTASGSVSAVRKAGAYVAAFANSLISGNPAMMMVDPSAALLSDMDPDTRNQLRAAQLLHYSYYEKAKEDIRKGDPEIEETKLAEQAQQAVLAPDSVYRQAVARYYRGDMVNYGVILTSEDQMKSIVRARLTADSGEAPSEEQVVAGMAEYEAALKDEATNFVRYTREGGRYRFASTRTEKVGDKWHEEALGFLTAQRNVNVEMKLDRNAVAQMSKGDYGIMSSKFDSASQERIDRVAGLTMQDGVTEDDLVLAEAFSLMSPLEASVNYRNVRRVARIMSSGIAANGTTYDARGIGSVTIRKDKATGNYRVDQDAATRSSGRVQLSSSEFGTEADAVEALTGVVKDDADVSWTRRPLQVFRTPATTMHSEDPVDILMFDYNYFNTMEELDEFSRAFPLAGSDLMGTYNRHEAFKAIAAFVDSKVKDVPAEIQKHLATLGYPSLAEMEDVVGDLNRIATTYRGYMAAAERRLSGYHIARTTMVSTGRSEWNIPPGAHLVRDQATGAQNLYITASAFQSPGSIAEDMIEGVINSNLSSFMRKNDHGDALYTDAVQGMVNRVRGLLAEVQPSAADPGLAGHLKIMKGIYSGDTFNIEAISKLISVVTLGHQREKDMLVLGYPALAKIADKVRILPEYKFFLAAVNDALGGTLPKGQEAGFDALARMVVANTDVPGDMNDLLRSLNENASIFVAMHDGYQKKFVSQVYPFNDPRDIIRFRNDPWHYMAKMENAKTLVRDIIQPTAQLNKDAPRQESETDVKTIPPPKRGMTTPELERRAAELETTANRIRVLNDLIEKLGVPTDPLSDEADQLSAAIIELDTLRKLHSSLVEGVGPAQSGRSNSLLVSATTDPVLAAALYGGLSEIAFRGDYSKNRMTLQFYNSVRRRKNQAYTDFIRDQRTKDPDLTLPDIDPEFHKLMVEDLLSMLSVVDGIASRDDLTSHGTTLIQRLMQGFKNIQSSPKKLRGILDYTLSQGDDKLQQLLDAPAYSTFRMFAGVLASRDSQPNAYFGITTRMRNEALAMEVPDPIIATAVLAQNPLPSYNYKNSEVDYNILVRHLLALDANTHPRLYALGLTLRISGLTPGRKLLDNLRSQTLMEAVEIQEVDDELEPVLSPDEQDEAPSSVAAGVGLSIRTASPSLGGATREQRIQALANGLTVANEDVLKLRKDTTSQALAKLSANIKEWAEKPLGDAKSLVERAEELAKAADALYGSRDNLISELLRDTKALTRMWDGGPHEGPRYNRQTGEREAPNSRRKLLGWFDGDGEKMQYLSNAIRRGLQKLDSVNQFAVNRPVKEIQQAATNIDYAMTNDIPGSTSAPDAVSSLQAFSVAVRGQQPVSRVVVGNQSVAAIAGGESRLYYDLADTTSKVLSQLMSAEDRESLRNYGTWADGTPLVAVLASYANLRGDKVSEFPMSLVRQISEGSRELASKGARYLLIPTYSGSHAQFMLNIPTSMAKALTGSRKGTILQTKDIFRRFAAAIPAMRLQPKRQNISVLSIHTHNYQFDKMTVATTVSLDRSDDKQENSRRNSSQGGTYYVAGPAFRPEMTKSHIDGPQFQTKGNGTYLSGKETFDDAMTDAIMKRVVGLIGPSDEEMPVLYTDREGAKIDPFYDTLVGQDSLADYIADNVDANAEGPVDLAALGLEGKVPGLTAEVIKVPGASPMLFLTRTQEDVIFHEAAHIAHDADAQMLPMASNIMQDQMVFAETVNGGESLQATDSYDEFNETMLGMFQSMRDSMTPAARKNWAVEILSRHHPEYAELVDSGQVSMEDPNVADALAKEASAEEERFRSFKGFGQHCQNVPASGVVRVDGKGAIVLDEAGLRVELDYTHGVLDEFSESSYVFTQSEQDNVFHGFSRRLALQRTNITQPWMRPGLFLNLKHPHLSQNGITPVEVVAKVIEHLYSLRGNTESYRAYLFSDVLPLFETREGEPLLSEDGLAREMSFDDLMVQDPKGGTGMVFDWAAAYWGKDDKDDTGSARPFIAGSLAYTSRTPSGNPNASDVYRISYPVKLVQSGPGAVYYVRRANGKRVTVPYKEKTWIPENINITQRTAISTKLAGLDNDGDTDTELLFKYDPETGLIASAAGRTSAMDKAAYAELVRQGASPDQARDVLSVPYMNDMLRAMTSDRRKAPVARVTHGNAATENRAQRYDYVFTLDTMPVNPKLLDHEAYQKRLVNVKTEYSGNDAVSEDMINAFPMLLPESLQESAKTRRVTYREYVEARAKIAGMPLDEYLFSERRNMNPLDIDSVLERNEQVRDADVQRGIAMSGLRKMHMAFARGLYEVVRGDGTPAPSATSWRLAANWLFDIANATFDEEKEAALSRLGFHQATMPMYIAMLMSRNWQSRAELHEFHDLWMAWAKSDEAQRMIDFNMAYKGDREAVARRDALLNNVGPQAPAYSFDTGLTDTAAELWRHVQSIGKRAEGLDSIFSVTKGYTKSAGEAMHAYTELSTNTAPALQRAFGEDLVAAPAIAVKLHHKMRDLRRKINMYSGHADASTYRKTYEETRAAVMGIVGKPKHVSEILKKALRSSFKFGPAMNHVADVLTALRIMNPGLVSRMREHGVDTVESIITTTEAALRVVYADSGVTPNALLRSLSINATVGRRSKYTTSFIKPAFSGVDIMQYIDQVWSGMREMRQDHSDKNKITIMASENKKMFDITRSEFVELLFLYNAIVSDKVDSVPSFGSGFGFMFPPEMMSNFSQVRTEAMKRNQIPAFGVEAALFTNQLVDTSSLEMPFIEGSTHYEKIRFDSPKSPATSATAVPTRRKNDSGNRETVSIGGSNNPSKRGKGLVVSDVFRFLPDRRIPAAEDLSAMGSPNEKPAQQMYAVPEEILAQKEAEIAVVIQATPLFKKLSPLSPADRSAALVSEIVGAGMAPNENLDGAGNGTENPVPGAGESEMSVLAASPVEPPAPDGRSNSSHSILSIEPVKISRLGRAAAIEKLSELKMRNPGDKDFRITVTRAIAMLSGAFTGESRSDLTEIGNQRHRELEVRIALGGPITGSKWTDQALSLLRATFPEAEYDLIVEQPVESGKDMYGRADILAVNKKTGHTSVIDMKPWKAEKEWKRSHNGSMSAYDKQVAQTLIYQELFNSMGVTMNPNVYILFYGEAPELHEVSSADVSQLARALSIVALAESAERDRIPEDVLFSANQLVLESIDMQQRTEEQYRHEVEMAVNDNPGDGLLGQIMLRMNPSQEDVNGYNEFAKAASNVPPGNTEQDIETMNSEELMLNVMRLYASAESAVRGFLRTPTAGRTHAFGFAGKLAESRFAKIPASYDQHWGPKFGQAALNLKADFARISAQPMSDSDRAAMEQLYGLMLGLMKTRRLFEKYMDQPMSATSVDDLYHKYMTGQSRTEAQMLVGWEPPAMPQAYEMDSGMPIRLSSFKLLDGAAYFNAAIRPMFRGMDVRRIVSNRVLEGFAERYDAIAADLQAWFMLDDPFHAKFVYGEPPRLTLDEQTHLIRAVGKEEAAQVLRKYGRQTIGQTVFDTYKKPDGVTELMDWFAKTVAVLMHGGKSTDTNARISTIDYIGKDGEALRGPTGDDIRAISPTAASDAKRNGAVKTSTLLTLIERLASPTHAILPKPLIPLALNTLADTADAVHATLRQQGTNYGPSEFEQAYLARLEQSGWALLQRSAADAGTGSQMIISAVFAVPSHVVQNLLDTDKELQEFLARTGRTVAMAPRSTRPGAAVPSRVLDLQATADLMRQLNQEMTQDVMNQIPLSMGGTDAHMLFGVYDVTPFIPGTGYFRRGNVAKNTENSLRTTEAEVKLLDESFELSIGSRHAYSPLEELYKDEVNRPYRQLRYFADMAGEALMDNNTKKMPSLDAIMKNMIAGKYEISFGIPANPTIAEFARAIHRLALRELGNNAITVESPIQTPGQSSVGVQYGTIIRSMERMAEKYNMQLDVRGMNNADVYATYGMQSAGVDAFTAMRSRAQHLADGLRFRSAINMALLAEDSAGHPVVYALPGDTDSQIVPEEMWSVLAHWWSESNALPYDTNLSAKENAKIIFNTLRTNYAAVKGVGHGTVRFADTERHPYEAFHHNAKTGLKELPEMLTALSRPGDTESSILGNMFVGGDTSGFMTQLFEAADTRDRQAMAYTVDHVLQWSKAMSMSFSLFHLVATGWESGAAATGVLNNLMGILDPATMRAIGGTKMGKYVNLNPGSTGIADFVRMIHAPSDPFMIELRALMRMVNIPLSNRRGNPLDISKTVLRQDYNKMIAELRKQGVEVPERMLTMADKAMRLMTEDTMEYTFEYVANAVKMAVVANTITRLRAEAMRQGKWFDPIKELRKWGPYIGAEVGGMDPVMYPWATPQGRTWLNRLIFSWQWTAGAWEAGGLGVLTKRLSGFKLDKDVQRMMPLRWMRMYLGVMFGVPAIMQLVSKAVGDASGTGDDDDKWFVWNNEPGKTHSFNITPFLKLIARAPGLTWAKENVPLAGSLIPAHMGTDPTEGDRKVYMHFGKQGWEIGRWFTDFIGSAYSKTSLPVQKAFEIMNGSAANSDWNYEFKGKNLVDGFWGRFKHGASMFKPFSFSGMTSNADAGIFNMVGPIGKGVSRTKARDEIAKLLSGYARNDLYNKMLASPNYWNNVDSMLGEWLEAARSNGHDPDALVVDASRMVMTDIYREYYMALPRREGQKPDMKKIEKAARGLHRMDFVYKNLMKSVKARDERQARKLDINAAVKEAREEVYSQSFWHPNG